MAKLYFTLSIDGLEDESLVVRGFEGQESLSDSDYQSAHCSSSHCFGFRYHIDLASRKERISPEQVVERQAELRIYRDGDCVQRVHGIVRQFTQGDIGYHHTYYSLTLVPALERLSLRHNSRIFQQKTTMDIVSVLLEEMGIEEFAFALRHRKKLQPREFCVQYRETDLDFLHRLAAEEGWVYSFEHIEGKHTLLFSDDATVLPVLEAPVVYNNLSGGTADIPCISALNQQSQMEVTDVQLNDYSFKRPGCPMTHRQHAADIGYQRNGYEYYDYPGRYKADENGNRFSKIRLDYLRREAQLATGKSNQPLLRPGYRFEMSDHANPDMNRKWVLVSVTHQGTQPQALQEEGDQGATTYHNTFHVIPSSVSQHWRATPQPKPLVDGPMIATVVGPQGEEIYCDKYGRVKVHFPWDRYSNSDEISSCWIRVAQGWAGSEYGMMAIPRIGHEVIVEFLNGDPDQPIITGRTYHATNIPPYPLPQHNTKTVLRSETHQGSGFNELSFEDQAKSEKVYLHAQKDFEADVLNDHIAHIRHDKHLVVENDSFTQVKHDQHLTVEGESRVKISQDKSDIIDGSAHHKTGRLYAVQAGQEVQLQGGVKIVVEAGAEITLKAGGSFVKVDPAGVHVVGPGINLNSGGSAGSGSGFSGKAAMLPLGLESVAPPQDVIMTPLLAAQITADIEQGAAFTRICQKQPDGSCPLQDCPCGNHTSTDQASIAPQQTELPGYSPVSAVACEGDVFHLEIMGKGHPESSQIRFYDPWTDNRPLPELEKTAQLRHQYQHSAVYTWDWRNERHSRDVMLSLSGAESTIELPLFRGVTKTERQYIEEGQHYQLQSIFPVTQLPSFKEQASQVDNRLPIEAGYIYITYCGRIWREIEVSCDDGQYQFRDVDLAHYREDPQQPFWKTPSVKELNPYHIWKEGVLNAPSPFRPDTQPREASGDPLTEIWYPARAAGVDIENQVGFLFSEVPLSPARLNYLEAHPAEQRECFISPRQPRNINELPEMRPRDLATELDLSNPVEFNRDVSGEHFGEIEKQSQAGIKSQGHFDAVQNYQYATAATALKQRLNEAAEQEQESQQTTSMPDSRFGCVPDVLADAKQKQLRYLVLPNPLQAVRQTKVMLLHAINYYQLLLADAANQPHYKSALLVNTYILPQKLGKQNNTLHKYRNKVYHETGGRYAITLRSAERQACHKDIKALQHKLFQQLSSDELAAALRNLTSLDDLNALAGHILVNDITTALLVEPAELAALAVGGECHKEYQMAQNLDKLFNRDHGSPLSQMLFPEQCPDLSRSVDAANLAKADNDGSGRLTQGQIANIIKNGHTIALKNVLTPEVLALAEQEDNSWLDEDRFALARRVVNAANMASTAFLQASIRAYEAATEQQQKATAYEQRQQGEKAAAQQQHSAARADLKRTKGDYLDAGQAYKDHIAKYSNRVSRTFFDTLAYIKALGGVHLVDMTLTSPDGTELDGYQKPTGANSTAKTTTGSRVGRASQSLSDFAVIHLGKADSLITQYIKQLRQSLSQAPTSGNFSRQMKATGGKVLSAYRATQGSAENLAVATQAHHQAMQETAQARQATEAAGAVVEKRRGRINKLTIPYIVLVVEAVNVNFILENSSESEKAYTIANAISGGLDLFVASVSALNSASGSNLLGKEYYINKTVKASVDTFLARKGFTFRLISKASFLYGLGIAAGAVSVAVAVWDTVKLIQERDYDAAAGMAMVAGGVLLSTVSLLFTGKAVVLGLSMAGLLGLVIAVVGASIVFLFTDTPIESWLVNGPFGAKSRSYYASDSRRRYEAKRITHRRQAEDPDGEYAYLVTEPELAYQQLLSLLVNLSVEVMPLKDFPGFSITELESHAMLTRRSQGYSHVIFVRSNLAELLSAIDVEIRLVVQETLRVNKWYKWGEEGSESYVEELGNTSYENLLWEPLPDGDLYYLKSRYFKSKLPQTVIEAEGSVTLKRSDFDVRLQLRAGEFIFPQPPVNEGMAIQQQLQEDPLRYSEPDFTIAEQAYWHSGRYSFLKTP